MGTVKLVMILLYILAAYGLGVKTGNEMQLKSRLTDSAKLQNCVKQIAGVK